MSLAYGATMLTVPRSLPAMHSGLAVMHTGLALAPLMAHGVVSGTSAQIDQGLLALLILLITRFVDVFGNFLRSGLAFIALGLLMAVAAWALHRGRTKLRLMSEEHKKT